MINTSTALVLGVGASVPYGYPTRNELKKYINALFKLVKICKKSNVNLKL
jgi:hypothetical protein